MRYNTFSAYLKTKYGEPVGKICIDGGFTCPNRDGTAGYGGCIFCGERGSGEHLDPTASIGEQVTRFLSRPHKEKKFIAYFQNFTGTYADPVTLRERYDASLISEQIVALAVGTRPDAISEEVAKLLASYREKVDVWVELGLQTANEKTAKIINRGYKREAFERALATLSAYRIPVVVHLMLGLPGETAADFSATASYLSRFPLFGVKIHSVYVMRGTALARLYEKGEYEPITEDAYVDGVLDVLSRLSPDVVVHRLTGDCPSGELLAPLWSADKTAVLSKIRSRMEERNITEGCAFVSPCEKETSC